MNMWAVIRPVFKGYKWEIEYKLFESEGEAREYFETLKKKTKSKWMHLVEVKETWEREVN